MIRYVFLLLLSSVLGLHLAYAAIEKPQVLGFSDWKNQKIRAAFQQYSKSQQDYQKFQGSVFDRNQRYKQAERDYRVLVATRKLSIHDYFQMYIMTDFPESQTAMEQALKSLSQEQVANLLVAYQKSLKNRTQKLYLQRNK